jgi:hypothetical protein
VARRTNQSLEFRVEGLEFRDNLELAFNGYGLLVIGY